MALLKEILYPNKKKGGTSVRLFNISCALIAQVSVLLVTQVHSRDGSQLSVINGFFPPFRSTVIWPVFSRNFKARSF